MNENKTILKDKSFAFALRCVNLYKYLSESKREFVLSKQLLRSGTSVGANIRKLKMPKVQQTIFINSVLLKRSVTKLFIG